MASTSYPTGQIRQLVRVTLKGKRIFTLNYSEILCKDIEINP